ncbi:MAG: hypothetical protein ACQESN_00915 [Thermotogota bacterium]
MKKSLFYLNILIFIIIIANIYKPIEKHIQWVVWPFDMIFSDIYEYVEISKSNNERFVEIEKELKKYEIKTNTEIALDTNSKPGIILFENGKYYRIKTTSKIDINSLVIDTNKNLIGFVESYVKDMAIVKKLGWGDNSFFGILDNNDVFVKENNGDLYIELPEDITLDKKNLLINTPFYIEEQNINIQGEIVSKIGDNYIFSPKQIESSTVFILEVN